MGEAGTMPTQEVQVYTVVHIYCVGEETLHLGLEKPYITTLQPYNLAPAPLICYTVTV